MIFLKGENPTLILTVRRLLFMHSSNNEKSLALYPPLKSLVKYFALLLYLSNNKNEGINLYLM